MKTPQALPWLGIVATALLLALTGCEDPPPIRTYEVPKTPAKDRTLGAMLPQGGQVWFFKMMGPADAVKQKEDDFRQLVKSVEFTGSGDSAQPTWEAPEGWAEQPGEGMRYKTLLAEVDGVSLELTVTPLAVSPRIGVSSYQLANVNRWRDELGLRPIDLVQLKPESEELKTEGGITALLVDIAGEKKSSSPRDPRMGEAPFARTPPRTPQRPPASNDPSPSSSVEPKYEVPEGWSQAPPKAFARASYAVSRDGQKAAITLSELGVAGADLLPNINRWRRQVGLDATTDEQLQQELKTLELAEGVQADYVEIVGASQTILGAIAIHADRAWFFKLIGDNELARQEQANFEAFIQSTRFETSHGQ